MRRAIRCLPVNLRAFFTGFIRFQVGYTTDEQTLEEEDGVYRLPFLPQNVQKFWTYAAADDVLQGIIDAGEYETLSLLGFNWWHWLTRSRHGAWRSFYVYARVGRPDWIASARLN